MPDTSLPSSWEECSLGTVVDYGRTKKAEPEEIPADGWVLELEDIEKNTSKLLQRVTFAQRRSKSTKNRFSEGDVLYGKLRPYLNKVIRADQNGYCTTEIIPLKPSDEVNGGYLFHWLKHPRFLEYVNAVSHGLNMPRLGTEAGRLAPFVLAPINEQKRITDKLDSVLARVDACRERLDRVPAILKRFCQSVLTAATTGKLTEEWREERGISFSWRSATLGEVGSVTGGLTKNPKRMTLPMRKPFLRVANVYANRLELDDVAEIGLTDAEFEKTKLMPGDLLIVEGNGSLDQIGRAALWDGQISECSHQNHLIRWRPTDRFLPKLALFWLLSPLGRESLVSVAKSTAGLHTLSISKISAIPVMLPLQSEQLEIVRRVEDLFAYADGLEARYTAARKQVERLTPALLAKAFRGELVPQDPNDEPALVLLERIRAARTEQPSKRQELKPRMTKPSRNSKEKSIMAKSRFDDDVKGKPYLASLLGEIGGNAKIEDLFKRAELPVVDFYKQLAWEVENGHILDSETRLEVA